MKNLLFLLFIFLSCIGFSQEIKNVDAGTFKKLIAEKKYVLIDLRTNSEIEKKGKIPGALQIDYLGTDADEQISALDKSKSYLVYCAGGGRSSECAEQMQKLGFPYVVNLEKGFDDWKAKGLEVEKK